MTSDRKKNTLGRALHRATRHASHVIRLSMAGLTLILAATAGRAQSNVVGHASDFTSVEYYPAPNQQQMKSRLSGAEAQPLPGGLLAIKQLKLETFGPDGKTEIVVNAPECVYDQLSGTASSAGPLQVEYQEGKIRVAGEGFLWRQSDSFLTISNRVSTEVRLGSENIK
ncbi:MAG TPA: hypothetical protein VMA35_15200 [Candidatus Sulfopaludibacter sp.]|nr:hypothetical protein [Candidatus Sulfopaludibacter sp.]